MKRWRRNGTYICAGGMSCLLVAWVCYVTPFFIPKAVAGTSNIGGKASIGSYGGGAGYSVFGLPGENISTKWIVRMMIKKDDSARAMVANGLGPHVHADELPGWLVDVKVDPLKYGALSYFDFVKNQCGDVIGEQTEQCVALCKKHEETCPD